MILNVFNTKERILFSISGHFKYDILEITHFKSYLFSTAHIPQGERDVGNWNVKIRSQEHYAIIEEAKYTPKEPPQEGG